MMNTDGAVQTATSLATSPLPLQPEQILAVTRQSLREFGYEATTIRRIARMLGCAVGSIYRFFTDKRELLMAVAEQQLEPVIADIDQLPFEQSVRRYLDQVAVDPGSYWMMFWLVQGSTPGRLPPVVERIIAGWSRELGDEDQARSAWAMIHGCLTLGYDADELVRLINGLVQGRTGSASEVVGRGAGRGVNRVIQNVYVPKMPANTQAGLQPLDRRIRSSPPPPPAPVQVGQAPMEAIEEEEYEDVCLL